MDNLELIKKHDEGTCCCSFQHHIRTASPTYEKIIEKGEEIVPDVLKYLRDNEGGMSIMLLLWDILKTSPYQLEQVKNDKGENVGMMGFKVAEARQAWIDWGVKENLIALPQANVTKSVCDHIRESDGMVCIGGRCPKCNEIV